MKKVKAFALCASLLLSVSVFGGTAVVTGNTNGATVFNRPTETGARSSFTVPYNAFQFNVSTSGQFTFTLAAFDPANFDTFLHLFVNSFDPADLSDPAANFLAANDDVNISDPTLGSGLINFQLNAGSTYFLVVDGFTASDAGAYAASITGPGTISVVPEPSTTALVAVSLGMLLLLGLRPILKPRA